MNDYRWDTKSLRTRLTVMFGNATSLLAAVAPYRDRLIIENTDAVQGLFEDIAQRGDDNGATLFEFLTQDDSLIEEAGRWLAHNDPEQRSSIASFHAFAEDRIQPGTGILAKSVAVIIPDEKTAVLFKLFFSGRGF